MLDLIPTVARPFALVALAAAGSGGSVLSPRLALAVLGLPFAGIGALAYFGVWRRWARRRVYSPYKLIPLALWWMGVAFLVSGLSAVVPEALAGYVLIPCLAFGFLSLIGTVWLPRPLLPQWYKTEMGLERRPPRKRVIVDSGTGGLPSRGQLGSARDVGGLVGGVSREAPDDGKDSSDVGGTSSQ